MTITAHMIGVFAGAWFALMGGAGLGLLAFRRRNAHVLAFRMRLLAEIVRATRLDDLEGREDWQWRLDAFHAVPYEHMMWQVWRPVESFYPDRRFTRPRERITEPDHSRTVTPEGQGPPGKAADGR